MQFTFNSWSLHVLAIVLYLTQLWQMSECLREGQCEGMPYMDNHWIHWCHRLICLCLAVCVGVITKLVNRLESDETADHLKIEEKFKELCLETKKAENRFVSLSLSVWMSGHWLFVSLKCYYIGGLEESATKILGEMSRPLSWGLPADKVCEKLMKKDSQICDLRYGLYE